MRCEKYVFLLLLVVFLLSIVSCDRPNRLEILKYKRLINENRAKKNKAFKFSENSPIAENQRWKFKELHYFPVDLTYKVQATFKETAAHQELIFQTSSGGPRIYITIGQFDFSLHGVPLQLSAYQEKSWMDTGGHNPLFVPFTDRTTGESTYGGGRYLDIEKPLGKNVIIDFNLAYSPSCAYNHNYSCPIPPPENSLAVAVEAGEKK